MSIHLTGVIMSVSVANAVTASPADPEFLDNGGRKVDLDRLKGVFPENIKTVAVLTAASIPNAEQVRLGLMMLERAGLKVKVMPHTFDKAPENRKSIPLPKRMADFKAAWCDPEVDMIISTRGGKGAQDVVARMDWSELKKKNDPVVMGFSNITCVTTAMISKGAGYPIQGPNFCTLVKCEDESIEYLKAVLHKETPPSIKLTALRPGKCSGRIYAGHLAMLNLMNKGEFKFDPAGRVIFLECVRRKERELMLHFNSLLNTGFFDKAAGVVLCHFSRSFTTEEAKLNFFRRMAEKLNCPVYYGFPYGHELNINALDFQRTAVIADGTLTIK